METVKQTINPCNERVDQLGFSYQSAYDFAERILQRATGRKVESPLGGTMSFDGNSPNLVLALWVR
jgi:hypothetical protein